MDKNLIATMTGGLAGAELDAFIKQQGWTSEDADTVFVAKQEEHVTSKEITESISFKSTYSGTPRRGTANVVPPSCHHSNTVCDPPFLPQA